MRRLFALSLMLATATSSAPLRPIGQLSEAYVRNVPVSGSTLVGLEIAAPEGSVNLAEYGVAQLKESSGKLCLAASTRDGRYHASQAIQIVAPSPAQTSLGVISQIPDLKRYMSDDFAVKLEVRASCDEGRRGLLVPAVRLGHVQPGSLKVMLNLHLNHGYVQFVDDRQQPQTPRVSCSAISDGASTAFDNTCLIPIPAQMHGKEANLYLSLVGTSGSVSHDQYRVELP